MAHSSLIHSLCVNHKPTVRQDPTTNTAKQAPRTEPGSLYKRIWHIPTVKRKIKGQTWSKDCHVDCSANNYCARQWKSHSVYSTCGPWMSIHVLSVWNNYSMLLFKCCMLHICSFNANYLACLVNMSWWFHITNSTILWPIPVICSHFEYFLKEGPASLPCCISALVKVCGFQRLWLNAMQQILIMINEKGNPRLRLSQPGGLWTLEGNRY